MSRIIYTMRNWYMCLSNTSLHSEELKDCRFSYHNYCYNSNADNLISFCFQIKLVFKPLRAALRNMCVFRRRLDEFLGQYQLARQKLER